MFATKLTTLTTLALAGLASLTGTAASPVLTAAGAGTTIVVRQLDGSFNGIANGVPVLSPVGPGGSVGSPQVNSMPPTAPSADGDSDDRLSSTRATGPEEREDLPLLPGLNLKRQETGAAGQCSTGSMQCCNKMVDQKSPEGKSLLDLGGLLNDDPMELPGALGMQCTPVNVLGGSIGDSCKATAVCCEGTAEGGMFNFGCMPVDML